MNCTEPMTGTGAGYVMSAVFFGVGGALFLATVVLWGYLCRRYGRCAPQTKSTVNQLNSARTILTLISASLMEQSIGNFGRSTELNMYESIQCHPSEMNEPGNTSSPPQMVSKTRYAVESDYTLPRPDVTSTNDVIHGHVNAAIINKEASVLHETFDGSRMPKYRAPDVPSSGNDVDTSSETSDVENVEMEDSGEIASVKRRPSYVIQTVCDIDKDRPPTLPVRKPLK